MSSLHVHASAFANFIINYGTTQLIIKSTRNQNILDLLIVNNPLAINDNFALPAFSTSDHCISGLLTRLLAPRPRRDRDYSRHNPRRDRDETFVIRGETETRPRRLYKWPRRDRDETFVLLPQCLKHYMGPCEMHVQ